MKIMYLIDVYRDPYAGTEKQLYNLINGLDRSKFTPALTLFCPSVYIDTFGFPCQVNVLKIKRLFSLFSLFKMISFALTLRRSGYRIVHIYFTDASLIAPIILKLAGIKVIISRRDMGYWYTTGKLAILRLNRFVIDRVIVNCAAVKQITHKKEKVPLAKIQVIYNGYLPEKFSPVNPSTNKEPPFLKNGRKLIGLVANIRPVKRIDDLIHAFRLLRPHCSDTELVIVGSGDTRPLEQLARKLDITEHVHFLGAQTDILPIIRQFDVAVLCSDSEGLSNAIIEYMQCLVPVVCTDTGGNDELIKNGVTGYLVPVGNIEILAEKLELMLIHPERAAEMAHCASTHVSELCNLDKMLEQHAKLYEELLNSSPNNYA